VESSITGGISKTRWVCKRLWKPMIRKSFELWPVLLLLVSFSYGQTRELPDQEKTDLPDHSRQSPDYQVGPGDLLSIRVFGMSEIDQQLRVSNSGKVNIASVGIVSIAGLTVAQIENLIAAELRNQQLVKEPWVRIQVVEYNSQPVFAVGEVNTPGQFVITGEMRLLDLVTKSGGITPGAGKEAFLIRRATHPWIEVKINYADEAKKEGMPSLPFSEAEAERMAGGGKDSDNESIKINLKALKEGLDPALNLKLRGGDILLVPRRIRERIYIVGEVLFPGAYGLPLYYDHITAARAVSYAGGPLKTAKSGKAFIMRYNNEGGVEGVPFDFIAIRRGEEPDIPMLPNDIIFVPRSIGKTLAYNMLILVPHLVQQFLIF